MDDRPPLQIVQADTATQTAYVKLKAAILNGGLQEGSRLRIPDLVTSYRCGAIPLREALNRLTGEGLVIHTQQRGFAVAPVSVEDFLDLTRARSLVGEVAIRESVLHGDAAWEESVLVAHHRLGKIQRYLSTDPPVPNPEYDRQHREFHAVLLNGVKSNRMTQISDELFDHAERYRNLSRTLVVARREDEHAAIVQAVLARDVENAVHLLKKHIELTGEIVASHYLHSTLSGETRERR